MNTPFFQNQVTVGGRTFTNLANLKILIANVPGAGNWTTARDGSATAGYTPSGAKSFRVLAIRLVPSLNVTAKAYIAYGDNDKGVNSGSVATNPVYHGGGGIADYTFIAGAPSAAGAYGNGISEMAVDFTIPNGKFPGTLIAGGGCLFMFGYEV